MSEFPPPQPAPAAPEAPQPAPAFAPDAPQPMPAFAPLPSSVPVLWCQNLTKTYGSAVALDRLTISVPAGRIVGLLGPNGSGKSTILKTLSGQLKSWGGQIRVCGRELGSLPPKELSQKLALLLTEPIRPERMTCREVVETGRYPYTGYFGRLSAKDSRVVEESMALVEMEAFARAVCQEPEVLLLDEPTAFLDIYHKATFFQLLRQLTEERKMGVVISMHEPELAARVAGYAVCIRERAVFRMGKAEEVLRPEGVRELFGVPEALYERYYG